MGVCQRQGLGKLRHISTQSLWIQDKVRTGAVELRKVRGDINSADLFTKFIPSGEKISSFIRLFSCDCRDGRAASAPQLRRLVSEDAAGVVGEFKDADFMGELGVEGESLEAMSHDPSVLPHHYDEKSIEDMFPKVKIEHGLNDEFPDFCPETSSW